MKKRTSRKIIYVAILIIIILVSYGIIPLALNTSESSMHNGKSYYIYGNITGLITVNNKTFMTVNDYGNTIDVFYNGTAPATGSYVLIYGVYQTNILGGYIQARGVYKWYYTI
ncbi:MULTISPECIES: hypothetical protein [Acidiplasma]|jgi:hypothetical protein|uniref:hypothetical protein n=1 Tax=Acidiplasma TaxID=507753 RepID=UPI0005DA9255|nr:MULTISPECIES: hypothetical protein [unclassified Acidiplasma]KJE49640.1 hypothetical protein TZ01_00490 [Acidiplasma sp. MBA-1]WMT55808.1 MAG: hypothetical protein RE470_03965 [Acidiplasma sp.]